ncbi:MAG: hypothetical protein P8X57_12815 [Cyclobacteriaceae bacterium]
MLRILLICLICLPFLVNGQLETYKPQLHERSRMALRPLEDSRLYDYDVTFYHIDIKADNQTTDLSGEVRIVATVVNEAIQQFVLELSSALTVSQVISTGSAEPLLFDHTSDLLVIELGEPGNSLVPGDFIDLTIIYSGTPPANGGFFQGISNVTDDTYGNRVTWTLSEPLTARDWPGTGGLSSKFFQTRQIQQTYTLPCRTVLKQEHRVCFSALWNYRMDLFGMNGKHATRSPIT